MEKVKLEFKPEQCISDYLTIYIPLTDVSVFLLQTIHTNNHELKQILCLIPFPLLRAELAGGKLGFGGLQETLMGRGQWAAI